MLTTIQEDLKGLSLGTEYHTKRNFIFDPSFFNGRHRFNNLYHYSVEKISHELCRVNLVPVRIDYLQKIYFLRYCELAAMKFPSPELLLRHMNVHLPVTVDGLTFNSVDILFEHHFPKDPYKQLATFLNLM